MVDQAGKISSLHDHVDSQIWWNCHGQASTTCEKLLKTLINHENLIPMKKKNPKNTETPTNLKEENMEKVEWDEGLLVKVKEEKLK